MSVLATLLCFCTVLLVPIMGFLAGVFTPFPTVLFLFRWGSPKGFLAPGGAAVIGAVVLISMGVPHSIPYYLAMVLLGLVLGHGMRNGWSVEKAVIGGSFAVFSLSSAFFLATTIPEGQNPLQVLEEDFRQSFLLALQQAGSVAPEKPLLEEAIQKIVPLMAKLAPGGILSSLLVVSWLNLLVLRRYCRLHNVAAELWENWSCWKAPEPLVWGVIACGFSLLLPAPPPAKTLAMNILVVLGTVYLFQGMAVMGFFFDRWKIPKLLRAFLYSFVLLQQIATLVAIFMGLFDMWFDFRRLSRKANSTP